MSDAMLTGAAVGLASAAGFDYASTALGQPLEVARILLQVQWCPRREVWHKFARAGLEQGQGTEYALGRPVEEKSTPKDEEESQDDEEFLRPPTPAEFDAGEEPGTQRGGREFGAADDELLDEEEAATYFQDLLTQPGKATDLARLKRREVDQTGYVVPEVVAPPDEQDKEEGEGDAVMGSDRISIPILFRGGLWAMGKAVVKSREGWQGLFKGLTLTYLIDEADKVIVPLLEQGFTLLAAAAAPSVVSVLAIRDLSLGEDGPSEYIIALGPWQALFSSVVAHAITGLTVAPISTLRTRAIAQTSVSPHQKYGNRYGTGLGGLRTMAAEEGGWLKLWTSPRIFIPALLDCTLRPALILATPLLVDSLLPPDVGRGIEVLLTLVCQSASLLITLPIETVRRRLQATPVYDVPHHAKRISASGSLVNRCSRDTSTSSLLDPALARPAAPKSAAPTIARRVAQVGMGQRIRIKGLRTCVETRPLPYAGVFDGLYKIMTEETEIDPAHLAPGQKETSVWPGLPSLYRGFSIAFTTLLTEALLSLLVGEAAADADTWSEI